MTVTFPHLLAPDLIDQFDRQGFVVTPGVFSDAALAEYAAAVDAEVARRTADDQRPLADKTVYEQSFIQCMRLWETSPAVLPLTCNAALAGIAAQLLHVESVRLWQDQALYKEAGGRETTPHQDLTFWPLGTAALVSAWIPFDDVAVANGAMAYVPGSHKAGRLRVVDITHNTDPYDILSDPALQGAEPQWLEVPAGHVIWHHGLTVHQAAPNTTDTTRRVFTVVYIDAGARRAKSWPGYPLDRDGVAEGGLVAGPGMPVLWPPPAEPPTPPTNIGEATGPQMRTQEQTT